MCVCVSLRHSLALLVALGIRLSPVNPPSRSCMMARCSICEHHQLQGQGSVSDGFGQDKQFNSLLPCRSVCWAACHSAAFPRPIPWACAQARERQTDHQWQPRDFARLAKWWRWINSGYRTSWRARCAKTCQNRSPAMQAFPWPDRQEAKKPAWMIRLKSASLGIVPLIS